MIYIVCCWHILDCLTSARHNMFTRTRSFLVQETYIRCSFAHSYLHALQTTTDSRLFKDEYIPANSRSLAVHLTISCYWLRCSGLMQFSQLCCVHRVLLIAWGHLNLLETGEIILTFSVWCFKCQVPAVAGALFKLNTHCKAVFSLWDENDVHLVGQLCSFCLLTVNLLMPNDDYSGRTTLLTSKHFI